MVREATKAPKSDAPPRTQVVANPHRGEVPIEIGGTTHIARVNYERVAALIQLFASAEGGTGCNWGQGALQAWIAGDVEKVSAALAIVTGLSQDEVYKASPPWEAAQAALTACYNVFYFGVAEPPEEPRQEAGEADDPLAQSAATRIWNFWRRPVKQPSPQASSQANSGRAPSSRSRSSSEHAASGV